MVAGHFVEISETVLYSGEGAGLRVLPPGRLGVLSADVEPGKSSALVATVGDDGAPLSFHIPLACLRVLGGCTPPERAPDFSAPLRTVPDMITAPPSFSLFVGEVRGEEFRVLVFPLDRGGNVCGEPRQLESPHRYSGGPLSWGSSGAGSMDLALAVLRECVEDLRGLREEKRDNMARKWHRLFCLDFIAELDPRDRWSVTSAALLDRLCKLIADQPGSAGAEPVET